LKRFPTLLLLVGAAILSVHAQTPSGNPVPATTYRSMTGAERWTHYWKGTMLSPRIYGASLGGGFISHLENDPPEWRQGMAGYGRRVASSLGVRIVQETVHQAGSAAMGYDPLYRRCECQGVWRRSVHAVKWSFVTRNKEGQTRFDLPAMGSAYAGSMISMEWYPHRYTPWGDGVRYGHYQAGLVVGLNVLREFMPDVKRILKIKN